MTGTAFDSYTRPAQDCQAATGVPASVTLAQADLESSLGKHTPPNSNNFFGIKQHGSWPGVAAMTTEVIGGVAERVSQMFCKYPNVEAGFLDHAQLLLHPLYAPAMAAWKRGDLEGGIKLMAAHYATDPGYATKVIKLIQSNDLAKFDSLVPGVNPAKPTAPSAPVAQEKTMTTNQNTGSAAITSPHLAAAVNAKSPSVSKEGIGELVAHFVEGGISKLESSISALTGNLVKGEDAVTVATQAVGSISEAESAVRELKKVVADVQSGAWLSAGADVEALLASVVTILAKFGINYGPLNVLATVLMKIVPSA